MSGTPSNNDFRGFMIQGRMVADGTTPVGTFATSGTNYQSQCTNVRVLQKFIVNLSYHSYRQLLHTLIVMTKLELL